MELPADSPLLDPERYPALALACWVCKADAGQPCDPDRSQATCLSREAACGSLSDLNLPASPDLWYHATRTEKGKTIVTPERVVMIPRDAPARLGLAVSWGVHGELRLRVPLARGSSPFACRIVSEDEAPALRRALGAIITRWAAPDDGDGSERHRRVGDLLAGYHGGRGRTLAQTLYSTADGTYVPALTNGRHVFAGVEEKAPGTWPSEVVKSSAAGDLSKLWVYLG